MGKERLRFIKNTWINSNGTMHLGIPSQIIEKMELSQNDFLLIELVEESIIVIKKINPQISKVDLNKIVSHESDTDEKSVIVEDKSPEPEKEFDNPLKNLKL